MATEVLEHYLAPLRSLLEPADVTELVVNRPYEVGVESTGGWRWACVPELSFDWLSTLAIAAAAHTRQDIGSDLPLCSTVLPGGERCQIVVPPATPEGCISLTIRKPATAAFDIDALAAAGLFNDTIETACGLNTEDQELLTLKSERAWATFFKLAVRARKNVLVSGATGSGKTTFAKALIAHIPAHERLITIEDARELVAPHRNLIHLTYAKDGRGISQAGVKELLESALRMRPDRILLQELRDSAAFLYLRNVCSGHPGSITTIHADSTALAFEQMTLLVRESEAGRDLPRSDVRNLLVLLVDIVVQLRRVGGRFAMTEVYFDPVRKHGAGI